MTGHSYIIYGLLSQGATTLMYEGAPNWPDEGRFWEIVEKYRVNIFYTAPTAIRGPLVHERRRSLGHHGRLSVGGDDVGQVGL